MTGSNGVAVGALNSSPQVRAQVPDKPVLVCDCTLREGEQAAGTAFRPEDRVRLAHLLDEMGLRQIQLGYPGVSDEDAEVIGSLVRERLRADLEAIAMIHVPDWKRHVEATVASNVAIVSMQYGTSDIRLEKVLRVSRPQAIETMVAAVRYARELGARTVSFSPTDTTRTDLDFLIEICRTLAAEGCDRIRIADSMGAISPTAFRFMIRSIREAVPARVLVGVHCHNDFGLAMANICAALEGGADLFDGVVNALGERAGNTALDELVLTLEHLYGRPTGIDVSRFAEVSRLVEEMSGEAVPAMKAVVGRNAFAHQLDNHIRGIQADPAVYEPYPPELVGNRRRFPLGRMSGPYAVRMKLGVLGVPEAGVDVHELVGAVRKAAQERRGEVTDEEFATLVRTRYPALLGAAARA